MWENNKKISFLKAIKHFNKTLFREEHDTEKVGVLEQFLNLPREMTEEDFLEEVHRGTVPYAAAQKIDEETVLLIRRNVNAGPNCLDCVLKTDGKYLTFENALLRLEDIPEKLKLKQYAFGPMDLKERS